MVVTCGKPMVFHQITLFSLNSSKLMKYHRKVTYSITAVFDFPMDFLVCTHKKIIVPPLVANDIESFATNDNQ